jgi:hypothetical protein
MEIALRFPISRSVCATKGSNRLGLETPIVARLVEQDTMVNQAFRTLRSKGSTQGDD